MGFSGKVTKSKVPARRKLHKQKYSNSYGSVLQSIPSSPSKDDANLSPSLSTSPANRDHLPLSSFSVLIPSPCFETKFEDQGNDDQGISDDLMSFGDIESNDDERNNDDEEEDANLLGGSWPHKRPAQLRPASYRTDQLVEVIDNKENEVQGVNQALYGKLVRSSIQESTVDEENNDEQVHKSIKEEEINNSRGPVNGRLSPNIHGQGSLPKNVQPSGEGNAGPFGLINLDGTYVNLDGLYTASTSPSHYPSPASDEQKRLLAAISLTDAICDKLETALKDAYDLKSVLEGVLATNTLCTIRGDGFCDLKLQY